MHIDHKGIDILFLGKRPTQGLDDTTLTAEAQYSINFSRSNRKFYLSFYYNGSNSFLFDNATNIHQFKTKDYEIKNIPCFLEIFYAIFQPITLKGRIAKNRKTGCVYNFSVDYKTFDISDNTNIHIYLMKKHYIK